MELFDKLLSPVLNYGSEVWGFHDAPEIEKVHLKFRKNILGVKTSVQNDFVYGELHRLPMKYAKTIIILKYWLKIVYGEKSIYVNTCYLSSLQMMENSDLLVLISMLWHRQAIFGSKGDTLSSSAECRIRTQGLRHLFASRLNACWQTDWCRLLGPVCQMFARK